jgi:hypothetical protein
MSLKHMLQNNDGLVVLSPRQVKATRKGINNSVMRSETFEKRV